MSSQFIATLHSKHIFWDSWDNIFLSRARASRIRLPETYTASPQKAKKVLLTSNVQRSSVNSPSQEVRLAIAVNLTEVVRRYALSFELYTIADFSHPSVI